MERLSLLGEIARALRHYASGTLRVSVILSVLYAIGFALLRVPLWPVLAIICGFFNMIPIFGPVIAIIFTAGLTWADRGLYPALGVMIVFAVVQGLEGFYLTPRILGRRLSLHPLAVFLGLLLAGSLFGFFGLLLAVPLMAIGLVVWKYLAAKRPR